MPPLAMVFIAATICMRGDGDALAVGDGVGAGCRSSPSRGGAGPPSRSGKPRPDGCAEAEGAEVLLDVLRARGARPISMAPMFDDSAMICGGGEVDVAVRLGVLDHVHVGLVRAGTSRRCRASPRPGRAPPTTARSWPPSPARTVDDDAVGRRHAHLPGGLSRSTLAIASTSPVAVSITTAMPPPALSDADLSQELLGGVLQGPVDGEHEVVRRAGPGSLVGARSGWCGPAGRAPGSARRARRSASCRLLLEAGGALAVGVGGAEHALAEVAGRVEALRLVVA